MSNKTLVIIIVVLLVVFGGAALAYPHFYKTQDQSQTTTPGGTITLPGSDQQTPSSTPATTTQGSTMTECQKDFDQNRLAQNTDIAIQNKFVTIDVKDFGTIKLQLYDKDAPKAVTNFLRLTDAGYYDCLTFHRISKGFVIQGGDPKGDGTGGTSAYGKPFEDELNPNTPSYKAGYVKGVLAMANAGPNTNGSQFFIMLNDVPLDHNYTIFGKVVMGQDVVDKIGQVDITPNPEMGPNDGKPVTPVVMQKVTISNQ
jgi:cyclophilin family peptidyl-prolyl cis-trans isomerase